MSEFEIAYSLEFLAQDREAANQILLLGVQRGEAVPLTPSQGRSGHMACRFHLVHTATGEDEDGGSAATLLGYLSDGTYPGKPTDYTLVPIKGRGEF